MFAVFLITASLLGLSTSLPVANVWLSPLASLGPFSHQYHAQDGSGAYRYGYTGPHHAKMETRSNGITQGGYSYIDANGILQTVAYSADAENGFRVRASNLPQQPQQQSENFLGVSETPEVAAARKRHLEEYEKIEKNIGKDQSNERSSWQIIQGLEPVTNSFSGDYKHIQVQRDANNEESKEIQRDTETKNPFLLSNAEASRIEIPKPDPSLGRIIGNPTETGKSQKSEENYLNYKKNSDGQSAIVPLPNLNRNLVGPSASYVLPIVPLRLLHSSLRHTQDSLGQYDYSYVGDTSSKTESRSLDGTTRGAYSYVDANGLLQQVHYVADHNGFRVIATNLPEA